jgi:hypothetical protein
MGVRASAALLSVDIDELELCRPMPNGPGSGISSMTGDLPSSQLKSSSDPPIAVAASDADSASGGSYIDGFNIPCAAVASF